MGYLSSSSAVGIDEILKAKKSNSTSVEDERKLTRSYHVGLERRKEKKIMVGPRVEVTSGKSGFFFFFWDPAARRLLSSRKTGGKDPNKKRNRPYLGLFSRPSAADIKKRKLTS